MISDPPDVTLEARDRDDPATLARVERHNELAPRLLRQILELEDLPEALVALQSVAVGLFVAHGRDALQAAVLMKVISRDVTHRVAGADDE